MGTIEKSAESLSFLGHLSPNELMFSVPHGASTATSHDILLHHLLANNNHPLGDLPVIDSIVRHPRSHLYIAGALTLLALPVLYFALTGSSEAPQ